MSRKDTVMECKEGIKSLDEKIKVLQQQEAELDRERRILRGTIHDMSEAEFKEDGITNGNTQYAYLSLANTRISIRPKEINWDVVPCEKMYSLGGTQRHEDAVITETELRRRLESGELRKATENDKPIAKTIHFKEIRHHKDDLYIGVTARGKITLFSVDYAFNIEEKGQYFLVLDRRYDRYGLRKMREYTGYSRSKTRSSEIGRAKVIAHFTNTQDLVAYLI